MLIRNAGYTKDQIQEELKLLEIGRRIRRIRKCIGTWAIGGGEARRTASKRKGLD